MSFQSVQALADAVLLEGYVLYPYRATARKNQFRWTFGVLAPKGWSEAGGCESYSLRAECLVTPGAAPQLTGRLRFFQIQKRVVEAADADAAHFQPVSSLEVGGELYLPWEEGQVCEVDFEHALVDGLDESQPFTLAAHEETEPIRDREGVVRGRIRRSRLPLQGLIRVQARAEACDHPLLKVIVRVENHTEPAEPGAPREAVLPRSCVGTHVIMGLAGGSFLSAIDPPEWARAQTRALESVGSFPVLAGEPGRTDLLLAAPIILYDYARIAPESPGDLCDATEIDEILTLRTSLLTEREKQEARATDVRAAALVERSGSLSRVDRERLHGAFRDLHREEMVPRWTPPSERVPSRFEPGMKVRLLPSKRRTDAQDLLFVGRTATVESVLRDSDDREYLALTMDGDPGAELHRWFGRFHYYAPDEVELL